MWGVSVLTHVHTEDTQKQAAEPSRATVTLVARPGRRGQPPLRGPLCHPALLAGAAASTCSGRAALGPWCGRRPSAGVRPALPTWPSDPAAAWGCPGLEPALGLSDEVTECVARTGQRAHSEQRVVSNTGTHTCYTPSQVDCYLHPGHSVESKGCSCLRRRRVRFVLLKNSSETVLVASAEHSHCFLSTGQKAKD